MSGPGDPEWERRNKILLGEDPGMTKKEAAEAAGAGRSTADRGDSPSFTGDGPAGESVTGGVEIADEDDSKKK